MTPRDNDIDATVFEAAERRRAEEGRGTSSSSPSEAYFLFQVGGTELAVPAAFVESVAEVVAPVRVPHTPPYILGLVLHGEAALPILDVARFVGLDGERAEQVGDESARRFVFVRSGEMVVGLLCDRAAGVRAVERGLRQAAGVLKGGRLSTFLEAELELPDARVGVLSLERFIEDARMRPDRDEA